MNAPGDCADCRIADDTDDCGFIDWNMARNPVAVPGPSCPYVRLDEKEAALNASSERSHGFREALNEIGFAAGLLWGDDVSEILPKVKQMQARIAELEAAAKWNERKREGLQNTVNRFRNLLHNVVRHAPDDRELQNQHEDNPAKYSITVGDVRSIRSALRTYAHDKANQTPDPTA